MTVFLASLFLPKTVYFNLPNAPPQGTRAHHKASAKKPPKIKTGDAPLEVQPSLFQQNPAETPPETPVDDDCASLDSAIVLNEDGEKAHACDIEEGDRAPADQGSPKWGSRINQPKARSNSHPPQSLLDHARVLHKAQEMGRQGVTQPRAHRSDSHDRVFASADWRLVTADQGNGGLRNAANAAVREAAARGEPMELTWVGTLGMPTDALEGTQQKEDIHDRLLTEENMLTVFCSDKDFRSHYSDFCKQILWPVFHYQIPDNPKSKAFEDHSWKYYVRVNQAFADKIVKNWKRGDVIWVHDYHLLLVPGMVRKKLPDAKIGLFLHVAFPSSEVFRCLAVREKLLEGMLGANLIGFQISEYVRHFLQTCGRLPSVEATEDGVQLDDRFVKVTNLAIGVDPVNLNEHRVDPEVDKWIKMMRDRYKDKVLIVARDKLDHVRGVRQKLLSYELFLKKNPEWRDKMVLIQVALSTSDKSRDKSDLDAAISDIVTRVNSSWASLAYQPLVYLKQDIPYSQYLAMLTIADVLMITSQREGMNLTSHEFIVCQDGSHVKDKKHGCLILSEFTGTSFLFGGNELSVNPWSYRQCAEAIERAVAMPDAEKASRWEKLHAAVQQHTGGHWFKGFVTQLDQAYDEQQRHDLTSVPRLNLETLRAQYSRSRRRLIFLELEGTLTPSNPMSSMAPINLQRTITVLNNLVADNRNTVYIMSGRHPDDLYRDLRLVPNVGLIAESGCAIKYPDDVEWASLAARDSAGSWKQAVKGILQYYHERTPGSEIEERLGSVVFHYQNAEDVANAERQASDWIGHVNESCEKQRVHATQLQYSAVVESLDCTKTTAAERAYSKLQAAEVALGTNDSPIDFLMVVGDGRGDEQVFKWANRLGEGKAVAEVVTVSLGNRNTEATATLTQGVSGVLLALQKLTELS